MVWLQVKYASFFDYSQSRCYFR
uniref:Uncharacterized protein n=1 Tax=Lepeophtheirus salmonis TaxID=72036 RepID=A0A0K2VD56_LEPSM